MGKKKGALTKASAAGRRAGKGILPALVALLIMSGPALWVWQGEGRGTAARPAALIEGEAVFAPELEERLAVKRRIIEGMRGRGIFSGEDGQRLLRSLEKQVLEEAVEERLIAGQARRLNIQVSDEEVRREMEKIGREVYGDPGLFEEGLRRDGISREYLARRLRHALYADRLAAAKAAAGEAPAAWATNWLAEASRPLRQGGCCPPAGPQQGAGCSRQEGSPGADWEALSGRAKDAALSAYRKGQPGAKGVSARALDMGCHIQVDIEKEGRIVRSYAYRDGRVTETGR